MSLVENVLKILAQSVLLSLGLTAAAATEEAIHKKMFGSGRLPMLALCPSDSVSRTTTLIIISNEKMNDIMKIVNSQEDSGLLIKEVRETDKNEAK